MGHNKQWIHLKGARVLFELLFKKAIDISDVEITAHFKDMQRERKVELVDIYSVIKKGFIKKEYKPDRDHNSLRWALCHDGITLVFTFDLENKHFVFITYWKGKEPKEGER